MSRPPDAGTDRNEQLMMAALDGELSDADREELDRALAVDPQLAEEYHKMTQIRQMTRDLAVREPPEEVWQRFPKQALARVERGLGWLLVSFGAVVLAVYGTYQALRELFADPSVPFLVKAAVAALAAGLTLLLVSIGRERLSSYKHEPYKEVER